MCSGEKQNLIFCNERAYSRDIFKEDHTYFQISIYFDWRVNCDMDMAKTTCIFWRLCGNVVAFEKGLDRTHDAICQKGDYSWIKFCFRLVMCLLGRKNVSKLWCTCKDQGVFRDPYSEMSLFDLHLFAGFSHTKGAKIMKYLKCFEGFPPKILSLSFLSWSLW